jgi:hypothetical protein
MPKVQFNSKNKTTQCQQCEVDVPAEVVAQGECAIRLYIHTAGKTNVKITKITNKIFEEYIETSDIEVLKG